MCNKNEFNLSTKEIKEVLESYGFTTETIDIEDLPEGVTALEFNSKKEMESYFENAEKEFVNQDKGNNPYTDKILSVETTHDENGEERSVSTIQRSTYKTYGGTKCNLIADIKVYSSGSFRSITGCRQRTNISGYTLGMGWRQSSASNNLGGKEKTSVTVKGSGQLITYLLSEGTKIEIARRNVDLSLYYSVY